MSANNASLVDETLDTLMINSDSFFLIVMAILISLMQCGFGFLEAGAVRSKNTVSILIKTTLDSWIGALAYWGTGWALAYGPSDNSFMGTSNFFGYNFSKTNYPRWFFQFVFADTSATIVSGSIAERCQFASYVVFSGIMTGWVYPVASHWAWDATSPGWLNALGFHDFAGSGVVHLTGGTCALIGCIIIGPRRGKFDKDGQPVDIPGHSIPLASLGGFILCVCFLAFNGGSQASLSKSGDLEAVGLAVVNTILGGSAGGLTALFFNKYALGQKWSFLVTLNGGLTGMVSMCSGCDVYPTWAAVVVGSLAGLVFLSVRSAVLRCRWDDPLDAVAVHMGGGSLGVAAVHVFAAGAGILWQGHTADPWRRLGVNVAGGVCISLWSAFWGFCIFYPLHWAQLLRVSPLTEFKGTDMVEHGETAYPADAWVEVQYRRRDVPAVMSCSSSAPAAGAFNRPGSVLPTAAVIMTNSKTTFGNVIGIRGRPSVGPETRPDRRAGETNLGFED